MQRPWEFDSPVAQNRARALGSRYFLPGRSWLDLCGPECLAAGITLEQLLVDERPPAVRVVLGRVWNTLRRVTGASDTEIAEAFGIRNGWEGAWRERAAGGA